MGFSFCRPGLATGVGRGGVRVLNNFLEHGHVPCQIEGGDE